ncbi:reverse transcriptase domain-containing protein [Tanacetum coccineum]
MKPPKIVSMTRDTSKYCEFHQDYGYDTNACRELKNQIEEVVKSGRLAHLIKGIRKGRAKQTDTQLEEWTTPTVNAEPVADEKEEPILMIRVTNNPLKRKEPPRIISVEEMIFPPIRIRAPFEVRERRKDIYTTLSGFSSEQTSCGQKKQTEPSKTCKSIEKLPTLVAPKAGESLIVYLAASKECVSAVLMAERWKDQRPIYVVSRVLQGAKLNYPIMEKLVLALIHVARRLKSILPSTQKLQYLTNKDNKIFVKVTKKKRGGTGQMGDNTQRTRNRIQAKECDQSTGPRRFPGRNSRRRRRDGLPE